GVDRSGVRFPGVPSDLAEADAGRKQWIAAADDRRMGSQSGAADGGRTSFAPYRRDRDRPQARHATEGVAVSTLENAGPGLAVESKVSRSTGRGANLGRSLRSDEVPEMEDD